jgi:hypothetical protein
MGTAWTAAARPKRVPDRAAAAEEWLRRPVAETRPDARRGWFPLAQRAADAVAAGAAADLLVDIGHDERGHRATLEEFKVQSSKFKVSCPVTSDQVNSKLIHCFNFRTSSLDHSL